MPEALPEGEWVRESADAAGARLSVDCAGELHVTAPPGVLTRIIDNLLVNALRYAPGPVDLVGQALPAQAPGQPAGVRLGVLDRGPGIPQDQLAAVFRPFHRLEGSRSPVTGGFGLGLAIVQQLARANGWSVSLEAREGGGLAAWVDLPGVGGAT